MKRFNLTILGNVLIACAVIMSQFVSAGGIRPVQAESKNAEKAIVQKAYSDGKYNDTHAAWLYAGKWSIAKSLRNYQRQTHISNTVGDHASFLMKGTNFSLIYTIASKKGKLDIFIDGVKVNTLNQSGARTKYMQKWDSPALVNGEHLIKFVHTDAGTVDVDGLVVKTNSEPTLPATILPSPSATSVETATPIVIPPSPSATSVETATPIVLPPSPTPSMEPTLAPTQIFITNYFVSPNGDNANPGTQEQPMQSIQAAVNSAPAGSTITVLAGNYAERVSVSKTLTIQAEGQAVTYGFTVTADNVTLRGFEVSETTDDPIQGWGIYLQGSNCTLENNYIHDATRGGLLLFAQPGAETLTANCIIRNNRFYRNSQVGIEVNGRNHLVENNEIWGTIQRHPKWINPPATVDADGIRFYGTGHIFRKNNIHDILFTVPENVNPSIDCFETFANAPHEEAANSILFEQNQCNNAQVQPSTGKTGKGFVLRGASNITVRNNIIKAYLGIYANNASNILTILNNTLVGDLNLPTSFYPAGMDFKGVASSIVKNNIFYNLPGHLIYNQDETSKTGMMGEKNLMFRADGASMWTTNTYSHANDLWGSNPLFVNEADYHLSAGSPAIDAGLDVSIANDYDNQLRPQGLGYDMGALESNNTSLPPATVVVTQTVEPAPSQTLTPTSLPPSATPVPTSTSLPPSATPVPTNTSLPPASSSEYFVAASGNDSNPGTLAQPWRTIQKAANTAPTGEVVNVIAGTYLERVTISRSLIFQAQGQVITHGFTIKSDGVTVRGFEITDTADESAAGWGIYVQGSNCLLENNYIHYATRGGIILYAQPGSEALTSNCVVRNNRLYHNALVGIEVRGRNHLIENNEVWATIQFHPRWINQPASWADADGMHFHGSGHVFRGNYIHDILFTQPENPTTHTDCFQTFNAPPLQEAANNILFENNRCDNAQIQTSGEVGKGFMMQAATNITIQNNIIKAYAGINANSGCNGITVLNNTFVSNPALSTSSSPVGIDFTNVAASMVKNNIFYNMPGHNIYLQDAISKNGINSGQNLMYRDDGKALWSTNTYSHLNDLWDVNPLFVSATDYHLQANSPAINAGAVVPVTRDLSGNPRPSGAGYDIGAFEFPNP